MISWEKNFQIVGTNPHFYLENFSKYFSSYEIGEMFEIDKENGFQIKEYETGEYIFNGKSDATLRQNIDTWISCNLFIKKGNILIKTINKCNLDKIIESTKYLIFQKTVDPKINLFRDTIKIKLAFMLDKEKLMNYTFYSSNKKKEISAEDIKNSIGAYENILAKDEKLMKFIEIELGE